MKIRIAFIIDQLSIGGTENQLINLANRLDPDIFEPVVVTLRDNTQGVFYDQLNGNVTVLGFQSFRDLKSWGNFFKFIQFLQHNNFHIVQTFFPESTFLGSLAARIARIPLIISTRRDMGLWHWKKNRLFIRISNVFADRVLANSLAVREYVRDRERFREKHIDVIYNGIDTSYFERLGHGRERGHPALTIGVVSNFNRPVKRFDVFLNAVKQLEETFDTLNFMIVGKVPDTLKKTIPENLRKKIDFIIADGDVRPCLAKMDIGVLCSDSEGFSNVVLEYMISGIACICTRAGGNTEIIEDGVDGLLFSAGDHHDLFRKVSLLIENEPMRRQLSRNAIRKVKETYDWEKIIPQYQIYYSSLISHKNKQEAE